MENGQGKRRIGGFDDLRLNSATRSIYVAIMAVYIRDHFLRELIDGLTLGFRFQGI